MVNRYVQSHYGCNCYYGDSSWKRYQRAHLGGDTLIFNYNYGYQGNCGGGCGMGFWGGVGLGLGNFFGNLLGGFMGGGMFGGFGNFWGGGMSPWICNWGGGGGGSSRVSDDDGDTSVRRSSGNSGADTEYAPINAAREQLQKLQYKTTPPTEAELTALETQINALTATDGHNDDDNKKQIELLKLDFNKLKEGKITTPDGYDILIKGDKITFKVGDKDITASPTDLSELTSLAKTPEGRTALQALPKDTARVILTKLGYINDDNYSPQYRETTSEGKTAHFLVGKFTNEPAILCLLKAANISVEVEYNSRQQNLDHWFVGTVDELQFNEDGSIKQFKLDCSTTGHPNYRGTYTVTRNDETYTPTGTGINTGTSWTWQGEKKPLLNTGDASRS